MFAAADAAATAYRAMRVESQSRGMAFSSADSLQGKRRAKLL
jgi:hypothetical protein